jgi:hypothetical protein
LPLFAALSPRRSAVPRTAVEQPGEFVGPIRSVIKHRFPSTPDWMAARLRGRTIIASQRIIEAKFDTEKRF